MMVNPMQIDAQLRAVVKLEWEYEAMVAHNYARQDCGWPPGVGVDPEWYAEIGLTQHRKHVELFEARQALQRMLEAPADDR